ncbi:retropepsin-like aspartic protease family protein [Chachezhania antarctica]|uniref:retropepsin-like aspartic protease family protein n=1 Tax=Chachezhania antarctica TaxID=2340860 RepID=UPI000EB49DA5|nr:TIGR02281 family clan AA aspartic protease [Chachezhania antarctica]
MNGDDYARLGYLALLGCALIAWLLIQNRHSIGRLVQQIVAWVLIFAAAIAVFALWDDIGGALFLQRDATVTSERVEIPRARDGHYYVTIMVNDVPVDFVVDTGATDVVLTAADAERAGFDLDQLSYSGSALTANGRISTAPVSLDRVSLGPNTDYNVRAVVNRSDMQGSLLGVSYLDRWRRIEIADGAMVLSR